MHPFTTLTVLTLSALTAAVPHARNQFSHFHIRDINAMMVKDAPIAGREVPGTFNLSPIGTCGGTTGYQCGPGFCCSKWGYCGQGEEYCGAGDSSNSSDTTAASNSPSKSHPHHRRPKHGRPHFNKPPPPPPAHSPPPSPAPAPSSPPPAYSPPPSTPSTAPSTGGASWAYKMFTGDGSSASGWPSQNTWIDFETAFQNSVPNMKASCAQWSQENDSDDEIAAIKAAILSSAASSGVDERFILAVMMQESNGCVRVQTTDNGVRNPGLMQSHNGAGTCWNDGVGTVPCPSSQITSMIQNGVEGTPDGDGLQQCLTQCPSEGSQSYYQAAVIYNSGNLPSNLDDNTATPCYASDIANRLMGWFSGTSTCTL